MTSTFLDQRALIAILRGVHPHEVVAIGEELVSAGITLIEVPLNSPEPFASIGNLVQSMGDRAICGAGTVLEPDDVDRIGDVGGRLVISPNFDERVVRRAKELDLVSIPGVFTATEAFAAIRNGADALKIFPADRLGPGGIKALKAVLPDEPPVMAVGGAGPAQFADYIAAGTIGFGIGSNLYKPGASAADVGAKARQMVQVFDRL